MACSCQHFRDAFVEQLSDKFTLRDNGPLTWVFGATIAQDLRAGTVKLHQQRYTCGTMHG